MENVNTYFLGAFTIDHQTLGRINPYRRRILSATEEVDEAHITVLPPFKARYEDASSITVECG